MSVRLRAKKMTLAAIAEQLTEEDVPTGHGGQWHPATVARLLER